MTASFQRTTWKQVLRDQGRTLSWLADRTGKSRAAVYAYSLGTRRPPKDWLTLAALALGLRFDAFHEDVA